MTINELILKGREHATPSLKRASRPFRRVWPRFPEAVIGMFAMGLVGFVLSTYSTTLARYSNELFSSDNEYVLLVMNFINPFRNRQVLLKSGLPIYDLKIKRQEYIIAERTIEKAQKQGWMDDELKIWSKAKFFFGGKEYDVKVRVRGDLPPHWSGPKKSWRVKFGEEEIQYEGKLLKEPVYFQGKRQINLIIPIDRDYVLSYFINSVLREKGLVVPRDQFVILRINGSLQGLYYEVEHFDKPLLAYNRRPETTVFAQNDRAMHFEQYTKYGAPGASDAQYDIGSMRRQVDPQGGLAMRAMQILIDHSLDPTPGNFRRVRSVLDWEKYLWLRVLTTLCNTNHVRFGSDNLKLYYDSSRGLLEPIPWDMHVVRMPKEPGTIDYFNSHGPDEIERATLLDPGLRLQRNRMLWELVKDGGSALMAKFDAIFERIRPLAWADVLSTPIQEQKMDGRREDLAYNVRRVYKVLGLSLANVTYCLEANDRAAIDIVASNFSGVEVQDIEISDPGVLEGKYQVFEDVNHSGKLDANDPVVGEAISANGTIHFTLNKPILPAVGYDHDSFDGRYWEYFETLAGRCRFFLAGKLASAKAHPLEWKSPSIQVTGVNAVTGVQMRSAMLDQGQPLPEGSIGITAYDASAPFDLEAPEQGLIEFLRVHPEFRASDDQRGAAELAGRLTIDGTVIVPKSVPLIIKPGADITMMPGASVLTYGGLRAIGTPDRHVRIHGNGQGETWGVLAAVRPPQKVVMRYIDVQGGGQAQINGILFTGGLAIHEGDLDLENARIVNMQSEDSLNVKEGKVLISDCLFGGGASDGIDFDFVTGQVRNSAFLNNQGDGLDLSGSRVEVVGSRFENMGDKGISVGEDSHPVIINSFFRGNQIGISTKDLSWARVTQCTFVGNSLAIEAKRKKPMFGAGGGEFINSVFSGNKVLLHEDYFSKDRVKLESSLLDRGTASCSSCEIATIRFVSPENGDYRIAAGVPGVKSLPLTRPAWIGLKLESNGAPVEQPGIFGYPLPMLASGKL